MQTYLNLLQDVLNNGSQRQDRTGTGTLAVFARQVRYNLNQGFPLLTTKKLHLRSIIIELLWFLKGDSNIKYLQQNGVNIWNQWADENGELGPVYGKQWRQWQQGNNKQSIDQISILIDSIKNNPHSRRHIVSAWNVAEIPNMKLPPCHCLFQFYIQDQKLSCQLYQRSADIFLGVPFNIASYALLTMMVAQVCELELGEFIHSFGDLHLYTNHIEQAKLQLARTPYELPTLKINPKVNDIFSFTYDDFELSNYDYHPHIPADIAV